MGRGLREAWFRMASKGGSAPSLYAILGLNKDSSDVEIRSAYRKLAKVSTDNEILWLACM